MQREAAETLSLEALAHVIADEKLGPAFLDATGIAPADLAARATEAEVLRAVLGFLLQDDRRILDFCRARGYPPEAPAQALASLPGGGDVHWT
ncbi:MAG: DUF3572 domain-containing protein [Rubellimicrobium sp.]|nr:DUF3572 domain-containing protein [Rubellimicrobium sp.]